MLKLEFYYVLPFWISGHCFLVKLKSEKINLTSTKDRSDIVQMAFVDIIWCFSVHNVQLAGQVEEIVVQMSVGHNFDDFVKIIFFKIIEKMLLSKRRGNIYLKQCHSNLMLQKIILSLQSEFLSKCVPKKSRLG